MFLSESVGFLFVFLVIIFIGFFIVHSFRVAKVKRFELLVTYLGALSVFLLTYNIFINIRTSNRIEKNRFAYNTLENVKKNYLLPQKELVDHYPEGYFLYASMNQDTDLDQFEPKHFDPIKRREIEVYASLRIFQALEDFLSTALYDLSGVYSWVNTFLRWMQSPILRHYWKIFASSYSDDTRELIVRIIEKSDELIELRKQKGHLTTEDYDAISKNFPVVGR